MSSDAMQEIEAKFYVRDLKRVETRLQELEARLLQPRIPETNLRFDLPDARLRSEGRVLRLRQDTAARLTYKDSGQSQEGVIHRTEIEFVVEDFEKARAFLEALGYQKLLEYDKYRTTYELNDCHIMLDELPYGNFVEVEGSGVEAIQSAATSLQLKWDAAIIQSYSALFETVKHTLHLSFQDLSFQNFAGIKVTPEHLGITSADRSG